MGHTKNSIVIKAPIDEVFRITNDLTAWPDLFTEYAAVEVLERNQGEVRFRLTTHPDEQGRVWSWQSVRRVDPDNYQVFAEREAPAHPFAFMKIQWTYDPLPEGTEMTWIQDFAVAATAGFSEAQAEEYLNRNTIIQQQAIKEKIEARLAAGVAPYRGVIIARIRSGSEAAVAAAFAESDRSELPRLIGVRKRSVWVLGDIYVHFVEADRPLAEVIRQFRDHPLFVEVKGKLDQHVYPLAPKLVPGVGREIYRWDAVPAAAVAGG